MTRPDLDARALNNWVSRPKPVPRILSSSCSSKAGWVPE